MNWTKYATYSAYTKTFKLLRLKHNYTKVDLAYKLHVSSSSVANHESGKSMPDLYTIAKYCKVYNITLVEFFHLVSYTNDNTTPTIINSDIRKDALHLMITA